jgi:hypothetical protein
MFRLSLLALGIVLLAIAAWLLAIGQKWPGIYVLVQGALITLAMVWEPWRYRRRIVDAPPQGFTRTEERFEDPGSGRTVTVYVKSATGERAYVADKQ